MSNYKQQPKGWHSRGYLPHLDVPSLLQSVTFHLADSLPKTAIEQLYAGTRPDDPEQLRRVERWLDAGHGACWLARPEIARVVEEAFLHFDGERYRLLCWVVMPNHVHLLIETSRDHPLPNVVQAWKSYSSKRANRLLERTGTFWARDYFDRYIRDDQHLQAVVHYIENNPVRAGLVDQPEGWPFGSARRRKTD
jgi:type I restriction enzyme R subunit/menaquinone-specific isochorismate synthase/putative DNA methylase